MAAAIDHDSSGLYFRVSAGRTSAELLAPTMMERIIVIEGTLRRVP